jgi:hypothetical protein
MEEKKDGIISVEAEKIIPMTKGEWKEFQKQMRMEGDYFYMVGNKKYVHYDGEDYLRMEDYRQELDKAREEGYQKGWEDQQHLDGLFYGTTVATTTTLEEGWILKHKKKVEEELSKLTTNLN